MSDIFPDFEFKKTKKRVKKTYVKKQFILDDDNNIANDNELESFTQNSDIESKVSQFISHLNNKNIINNDLLSKEIANNFITSKKSITEVNISKHCYNNKRTMLIKNNDDVDDEEEEGDKITESGLKLKLPMVKNEEMSDDDATLVTSVLKPKLSLTKVNKNKTFSKIINSNSNLKYQQDYEFIINNKLPLYSQLLNLIDTFNEDKEFKEYLVKWNLLEFLNHCLNHNSIKAESRYLIMFVLIQLNVSMEEDLGLISKPLTELITNTIISSLHDSFQLNCITNVNRFTKSSILNFIKSNKLNHITNHHLCLKLWSIYYNHLPQLLPYINKLIESEVETDVEINSEYEVTIPILLSNIILKFGQLITDDVELNVLLLNWFLQKHEYMLTEKPFIMTFILLTNNKSLLGKLDVIKINKMISKIVNNKADCIFTKDRDILQLQICQMALCLNLSDYIDRNIQINDWDKIICQLTQKMIPQLSQTFCADDDNEFNLGMFILLFFLISYRSKEKKYQFGDSQDKNTLLDQLKSFKSIADNNITITNNIDLVIENFT